MKNSFLIKMLENCHMHLLMKKTMRIIVAKKQNIFGKEVFFMEKTEILARVDHTALKSTATWEDIRLLCEEAVEYKTASVCIPRPI